MKRLITAVKAFWADEEGATAIEYGLIVALIAVIIIAALGTVGVNLKQIFTDIASCLQNPTACATPAPAGG